VAAGVEAVSLEFDQLKRDRRPSSDSVGIVNPLFREVFSNEVPFPTSDAIDRGQRDRIVPCSRWDRRRYRVGDDCEQRQALGRQAAEPLRPGAASPAPSSSFRLVAG
jgi:hypothetical protein